MNTVTSRGCLFRTNSEGHLHGKHKHQAQDCTGSSGLLPDSLVAERYKVTTRTIDRWDRDQNLEFPEALRIRGRKYRRINQLENWERQRATSDERRGSKRAATTQPAHAE